MRVTCSIPVGYGKDHRWILTIETTTVDGATAFHRSSVRSGGRSRAISAMTSYLAPHVDGIRGAESFPTRGNTTFDLVGANFGPLSAPASVLYGDVSHLLDLWQQSAGLLSRTVPSAAHRVRAWARR